MIRSLLRLAVLALAVSALWAVATQDSAEAHRQLHQRNPGATCYTVNHDCIGRCRDGEGEGGEDLEQTWHVEVCWEGDRVVDYEGHEHNDCCK